MKKPVARKVVPPFSQSREAAIIERAMEVIGGKRDALRWMGTPVRALDYATPISLLHDQEGRDAVLAVLTRIEHGVL
jgi:putative toxin-antitoxin system antitoxin component (TIGR02293 family)